MSKMDTKDREFLRTHRRQICLVDFDVGIVAKKLFEMKLLKQNDVESISIEEKDLRRKEKLIDTLPRMGPNAFSGLKEVVKELKLSKLYEVLGGNLSDLTEENKSQIKGRKMDDCLDGPPKKQQQESKNPDSVDTPLGEVEDGRPSIFNKKKNKSDSEEKTPLPPIPFIEPSIDLEECYAMTTTPRGYFLLINNKNFIPPSGMENYPRNGTDVDGEALQALFQEMGFVVDAHFNLSVYEMRKMFKQAAYKDYSGLSCFCCCVLSHGQEGVLYGTDGTIDIREITSYFHGTNLAGKPKVFFFQACQGSEYMDEVTPDTGTLEVDGPGEGNDISLPSEADFLYAYSTVPGYYSWRNSQRGSWFVQAICEVFRRHAHKMDLVRMLTRVNAIVSTKKSQTGQRASHHKRQISSIVTQLRKELYFFPMHGPLEKYQGSY